MYNHFRYWPLLIFLCLTFRFHEFLKLENEIGNITRQEAVSMVGPRHSKSSKNVVVPFLSWSRLSPKVELLLV